ncbi:tetratricopeptide repeat protein, partial [Methylacidimicrobium tartarophylax]
RLLGIAYTETRDLVTAAEAFRQALKINPQDATAWYNLGLLYNLAGRENQVMEIYQKLKTLSPDLADKLFNLAIAPR